MRSLRFIESRFAILSFTVILKLAYDMAYTYLISRFFSWTPTYYPFSLNSFKLVESYALTVFLGLVVPRQLKKPSDLLLTFLATAVVLPMLTLYGLANRDSMYTYMAVLVFLLIRVVMYIFPNIRVPVVHSGWKIALLTSLLAVIGITCSLFLTIGFQHFDLSTIFDYSKMVSIRREVVRATLERHTLLAYLYFWNFIVFLPTLLVILLHRRRFALAGIFTIGQILLTGITARRHTLVVLPVLLGTYMISKKPRLAPSLMILGFIGIVSVVTFVSLHVPSVRIVGTWMERFFFVPPRLNYAYFEFFSSAGHVYLTSTKIPIPLEYPFDMIPERLVGTYILLSPKTVSSAGFMATSYMHAGFIGMVIFSSVVAFLLKLVDSLVVHRIPLEVGTALSMVVFSGLFRGADLTQWLLTFGGAPLLLLLALIGERV
ncbi:MAG: hypothetical protein DRJ64_06895 [Thermoprotei archaeon]|nr:MAG: hypothetical protein DRJ64_06895 [Thermoprotei archaeon]